MNGCGTNRNVMLYESPRSEPLRAKRTFVLRRFETRWSSAMTAPGTIKQATRVQSILDNPSPERERWKLGTASVDTESRKTNPSPDKQRATVSDFRPRYFSRSPSEVDRRRF